MKDTAETKSQFKAIVYARTSTAGQADPEKISIPEQVEWAEGLCKERGWTYAGSYIDTLPGEVEFDKRPDGNKLLDNSKHNIFNLVLFYHSSRLAREPWVGLKTISILGKQRIQVYIRNAPIEPLPPEKYVYGSNVAAEYINALSLVGDKQENIARSERVTMGFKNLAQRGYLTFAPYGFVKIPKIEFKNGKQIYTWSFEKDPIKSLIVIRIFKEYDNGKSLRKIVKDLIADNIPSPSGKTSLGSWSAATIRNILKDPAYIGLVCWGKKLGSKYRQGRTETGKQKRIFTKDEQWIVTPSTNSPKIIEDDTLFYSAQERLKQRSKISGRQLYSPSLLAGLVYCGDCQLRAVSRTRKVRKNGSTYIRTDFIDQSYSRGLACRQHLMAADKLEHLVLFQLQTRLNQLQEKDIEQQLLAEATHTKYMVEDSLRQVTRQINSYSNKKSRLLDLYINVGVNQDEYIKQKEKLEAEEATLLQEQKNLLELLQDEDKRINTLRTLKDLLQMFSKVDDPKIKKEMLQRIIDCIIIKKDKVEIIYKYNSSYKNNLYVNPCPCGYLGDKTHNCICTPSQISRYKQTISGPLLDRIDIHLDVPAVKVEKLTEQETNNVKNLQKVRNRVQKARNKQNKRYKGTAITSNAELTNKTIKDYCKLTDDCIALLRQMVTAMSLSGRAYYHINKLSRTIADLADEETIRPEHIAEALQYRPKGDAWNMD